MEKIVVRGGRPLEGSIKVQASKNAVLPILAASLLADEGICCLQEVPELEDVRTMCEVLKALGVKFWQKEDSLYLDAAALASTSAPAEPVRKMRASFLIMGPLLARAGHARVSLPGGCAIGTRPVDQHLKGFEALGATIDFGHGYVEVQAPNGLRGSRIYLDVASVGATENIIMAASLAEGTTFIENAAQEPEIVDLANFINGMGGKVRGAGTGTIRIEGADTPLTGVSYTVIPDRIEAGTFLVAAAATGGRVLVEGAIGEHLNPVLAKLTEMGVECQEDERGITVCATPYLRAVDIKTLPYPGFPTDMQAPMMALSLLADGTSVITETVFENRFQHVNEFCRMGAKIKVDGHTAIVEGGHPLKEAQVQGSDLRATAALVIAGMAVEGETQVYGLNHLDRGYTHFVEKLRMLGADIERVVEREAEAGAERAVSHSTAAGAMVNVAQIRIANV